ncbi:adapter protein MecA [Planococcus glaciei]|uniref:Adapter protein MecA n=1 Tax=Planococcus liqunii TaxID=3058394 RepID=A0ABT8MMT9_9BACL|nr:MULTISPECIES: adaptor protein MecA [Planococcus]KOF11463.1 adapter protein MecA [Planococcus glaciei]MBX0313546.1 adaptor protein MecA [Planococcus glaciei]MDN7226168.1 adaptor protein MecA [Planococcus sp. N064]WKA49952.1 adaptor protein MecA [Planococcus sp. N056]SDH74941.1 adapter protein MecA 1/2 [Planococcus glaciei]
MEIERINDNTVKFYISYLDVEERGFSRDEIWFNRDKSEELFWEMMDEVNEEADFVMEGPLWIQVQAMDKGLEVTVTRAQLTKDGQKIDLPDDIEERRKMFGGDDAAASEFDEFEPIFDEPDLKKLEYTFVFSEVDELLPLARRLMYVPIESALYHFENKYYLYVGFDELLHSESDVKDNISIFTEYLQSSPITIHRLEEYGKPIFKKDALANVLHYFG